MARTIQTPTAGTWVLGAAVTIRIPAYEHLAAFEAIGEVVHPHYGGADKRADPGPYRSPTIKFVNRHGEVERRCFPAEWITPAGPDQ